jgi:hypothetical protein
VAFNHPKTPPFILILFALIHFVAVVFDMAFGLLTKNYNVRAILLDVVRIAVTMLFIWLAGTFPLQAIPPSQNVADSKDVCISACSGIVPHLTEIQVPSVTLSGPEDGVTLWSWCTFSFVEPIIRLATARTLNDGDVWSLSPFFLHSNIFKKYLEYRSR